MYGWVSVELTEKQGADMRRNKEVEREEHETEKRRTGKGEKIQGEERRSMEYSQRQWRCQTKQCDQGDLEEERRKENSWEEKDIYTKRVERARRARTY